ncbi:MAG TPA: HPr-rel-A system PqqD family peptide chaperone [Chloroflexota bacterium]|nr:HPr-rel-A system PqqD family peptide chaperone [Chloroflexota bacterium]
MITSLDGETVLCDERSGKVYLLNPTGGRIWTLCDGRHTVKGIARALAVQYGLDGQLARTDVEDLLAQLLDADLIAATAVEDV